MSDGVIKQIQLPNGSIYDIQGGEATIDSSYDSTTKTVTLIVETVQDA